MCSSMCIYIVTGKGRGQNIELLPIANIINKCLARNTFIVFWLLVDSWYYYYIFAFRIWKELNCKSSFRPCFLDILILLLLLLLVLLFGMVVDFVQTASGIRALRSHSFTNLVSDFSVSLKSVCLDQATWSPLGLRLLPCQGICQPTTLTPPNGHSCNSAAEHRTEVGKPQTAS